MHKEESVRDNPSAAKRALPASPAAEAYEEWSAWRKPRVFLPLSVVFLMVVGIVVSVLVSKGGDRNRGDIFNTTVPQSQNTGPVPTVNSSDEAGERDVPQAPALSSPRSRRVVRAPTASVVRPQQSVPPVAGQPGVSIHVDHSPGAITAQNITANNIEVRTPQ
jgi:hypothetical protein